MSGTYHRGRKRVLEVSSGIAVSLATVWLILRWRPFRVEIRGDSMAPTLLPGDSALAVSVGTPTRGHVVVVEHPERYGFEIVKRIVGVPGDLTPDGRVLGPGEYWIEGDNPSRSTDSRQHGPVSVDRIRARVRLIYRPASRRGLVSSRRTLRV
jgi:signal peptidase I